MRLSPETCRVKPLRRIKTQLLHLVGLISLLQTGYIYLQIWTKTFNKKNEKKKLLKEENPILTVYGECKKNMEIDNLMEGTDIVRFIKAQRVKWLGHIQRMDRARPAGKLLDWRPMGTRP